VPRTAFEWGFKDEKQTCSTLDYPRRMKVGEIPVGLLYRTAALGWNLGCCAYRGATFTFFKCPPPIWKEYLGLQEGGTGGVAADSANDGGKASAAEGVSDGVGVLPVPVKLDAGSNADGTAGGQAPNVVVAAITAAPLRAHGTLGSFFGSQRSFCFPITRCVAEGPGTILSGNL